MPITCLLKHWMENFRFELIQTSTYIALKFMTSLKEMLEAEAGPLKEWKPGK